MRKQQIQVKNIKNGELFGRNMWEQLQIKVNLTMSS